MGKATINCAVLGLGRMGFRHTDVLARLVGARVHGVYDAIEPRTREVAERFGAKAYGSWQEAVNDSAVDAVFVVTPVPTHKEICLHAAAAKKATFCEKPLAVDLEESDAIDQAVRKSGILFQLGFMRRFDPGYAAARKAIDEGVIGDVVAYAGISRDKEPPAREYVASSGGIYLDALIHEFDIARFLMQDEVAKLFAFGKPTINKWFGDYGDVDHAHVILDFRNGGIGHIEGSRNGIYGYDIRAEVMGSKGTIQIGYGRETPILVQTAAGISHDFVPGFLERFAAAYEREVAEFISCVQNDRQPIVGAWDGRQALVLALAAGESQRAGQPVVIR